MLTSAKRKDYKKIAHHLSPVVSLAENSVEDGAIKESVVAEVGRALDDHELIKVKVMVNDREVRQQMIEQLCEVCSADLVQSIGKLAVIVRPVEQPKEKLSNIIRFKHLLG